MTHYAINSSTGDSQTAIDNGVIIGGSKNTYWASLGTDSSPGTNGYSYIRSTRYLHVGYQYTFRYEDSSSTDWDSTASASATTYNKCTIGTISTISTNHLGYDVQITPTSTTGTSNTDSDYLYVDIHAGKSSNTNRYQDKFWFKVVSSTITYDANGGTHTSGNTLEVTNTSAYTYLLSAPVKTGYTFNGWYTAKTGGTKFGNAGATKRLSSFTYKADGTCTLYAQWTPIDYTITISAGTGGSVSPTSVTAAYGSSISTSGNTVTIGSTTVTATANSNYSFSSWTNASGTVTGDRTITANFVQNSYTVSFNGNGGTTPTSQTGTTITLPNSTRSSSSSSGSSTSSPYYIATTTTTYPFNGWYTSGGSYVGGAGSSYTPSSNITLYAHWGSSSSSTSYTYYYYVSYNANGGTGAPSTTNGGSSSSTSKSVTLSSSTPSRTGYTFLGWSTSSTATSASYSAGTSYTFSYGNTQLYAVWQISSYTISIAKSNGDYGTVSTSSVTAAYGTTYSASGNVLSFSNGSNVTAAPIANTSSYTYTFTGWSSTSGTITSATTITASFARQTAYTVTFNGNGGTPSSSSLSGNNTYPITLPSSSKSDSTTGSTISSPWYAVTTSYSLDGWYTASTGGTRRGAAGASYSPSAAETMFAQYNESSSTTYGYKITYDANGGSGAPSTQSSTDSSTSKSLTLSSTEPTRSGHDFLGWATSSTATAASYSPNTAYNFTYGLTELYAVWKKRTNFHVKVNGEWVEATDVYVKIDGEWVFGESHFKINNEWH